MQFTPKSQEEIALDRLWPDGIYPFTVQSAEDTVSKKSGKDMIVVELKLYNDTGRERVIKDYLMESMIERLEQFCRFTGLEDLYNSGNLTALDMENREGYVAIRTEKPKPGSDFKPKNVVYYYCDKPKDRADAREMQAKRNELMQGFADAESARKTEAKAAGGVDDEDDSIPF
jgi:hypothetical protein